MKELFQEYGEDTTLGHVAELLVRYERPTRARIAEIPSGRYTFVDYLDNNGVDLDRRVRVQATVIADGSDVLVGFAGTDSQVRGAFNATPSTVQAAAFFIVRALTDPSIPTNAGCHRPVRLPEGTLVNSPPHSLFQLVDSASFAVEKVLTDRIKKETAFCARPANA